MPKKITELTSVADRGGIAETDILALVKSNETLRATVAELSAQINAFRGALVKRTSQGSGFFTKGSYTMCVWHATEYDTSSFWSGTNPSRLTVPAEVNYVELTGRLSISGSVSPLNARIYKNSSPVLGGGFQQLSPAAHSTDVSSAPLAVSEGDYFELGGFQNSSVSPALFNSDLNLSYLAIKVLG